MTHPLYQTLRNVNIITDKNKQNPKSQRLFDKYPDVYAQIIEHTSFLPEEYETRARVHCIMHNITTLPVCKTCNKAVTFNTTKSQFNEYCCHECAWADPDNVAKAKQTKKERYGDENYNDREKAKATNLERYGATTPAGNESIVKKMRAAWTDEKTSQAAKKRAQTNLTKYGATTYARSLMNRDATAILADRQQMYDLFVKSNTPIEKISKMLKVGTGTVRNSLMQHGITKTDRVALLQHLKEFMENTTPAGFLRSPESQQLIDEYNLSKHETAFVLGCCATYIYANGKHLSFVDSSTSTHEVELLQFLKTIVDPDKIVTNTRTVIAPYELDFYIPHLNVAIEYNGVFWHSELNGRDRSYHVRKYQQCKKLGIDLIQVWSNEWALKPELVKSRLRAKLVGSNNRVFARKCSIIEMTTVQQRDFFEQNHIQGHVNSSVCYGLVQDDQIQCAMSFVKTRYDNNEGYELLRFANKIDTNVVGGASKLFKHFIKNHNPQRVVSYSMNRWNTGNLYQKLGFEFSHTSSPNYFYFERTDPHVLYSRVNFQKHKLKDKLTNFDPHLSEWENMANNGYDRIWDCGNDVWQWQPKGIDQ